MMTVRLPHNYQPRSYHRRIYAAWQRGVRHILLVMHRRSGKTESLVSYVPQPMLHRKGNYVHVFPLLQQAREVVWDGISRQGHRYIEHFPAPLLHRPPNKSELKITFRDPANLAEPGSTYQLKGTDHNINALVGGNTVGIIWDEYSLQNPAARDYARPILAENDGWEVLPYTPRGENHGYELYQYARTQPDWHVEYLTVDHTRRDAPGEDGGPVITVEAIEAHRKELQARGVQGADALIEQEYYLSWKAPMPGAYWGEELLKARQEGRITPDLVHDPAQRVYTAWDLGTSKAHDTNSIWFVQLRGNRILVIDYHQASNKGIPYYVQLLESKRYTYAKHFAMETDLQEADWGTGRTRAEQLADLGIRFEPVPKIPLVDGINAVRALLPRCVFAEEPTRLGVNGLGGYRREWDEAKKIFHDTPVHDWASHPASAFRYLAVGLSLEEDRQEGTRRGRSAARLDFDPLTVGRPARQAQTIFSPF